MIRASILVLATTAFFPAALHAQTAGETAAGGSPQTYQFDGTIREKLENAKRRLDSLRAKIEAKAQEAGPEVRAHLEELRKRIEQDRVSVEAAKAAAKEWVESRKNETVNKIADWKAKHEARLLQDRADMADRYAAAKAEAVVAAIDEAESAALEALLARQDAIAAQTN